MRKQGREGITLIELCIALAIVGGTILVVRVGLGFLMTIFAQTASLQTQREAEIVLYDIAKEARNAKAIVAISSGTLVLRSLNTRLGYDSQSSSIFSPVNVGTVTFQYETAGNTSYLRRVTEFPGTTGDKKFLKSVLVPPGQAHFIFRPMSAFTGVDPWSIEPPYEGVEVMLEVQIPGSRAAPKVFRTQIMKRSQSL